MSKLNILGIAAHYHDAAAALLVDGQLVAAAQEERFTRVKHDPRVPVEAVRYCLAEGGLSIAEVDVVAYYEDPVLKLSRKLWMGLPELPSAEPRWYARLDADMPTRSLRERLGFAGALDFHTHHASHAASAFFASPFQEAAVLVADGVGEWDTTSLWHGRDAALERLDDVRFPASLGLFYSAITAFLGFEVNDGEYKVMGLAPYGQPRYLGQLAELLQLGEGFGFALDAQGSATASESAFDFSGRGPMFTRALCERLGRAPRAAESEVTQDDKDLARSAQQLVEEAMLSLARVAYARTGAKHLCLAGGLALNCVANGRLRRESAFADIFVQPAASDAGAALGAALASHAARAGQRAPYRMRHAYLGPQFSASSVERLLRAAGLSYAAYHDSNELAQATAARLARGEVLGWFQGRMEFGPRALGARSILADPRRPEMRERVNHVVKKREGFRPFAPAVTAERASAWFALAQPAPFMLETCAVLRPGLPAVTHVDGSARVQTVTAEDAPRFHALLCAFERLTGCPVLLNTSFNQRGEPIVCSPEDALLSLVRTRLDALVIEDFIIERSALPSDWLEWFGEQPPCQDGLVSNSMYTFL